MPSRPFRLAAAFLAASLAAAPTRADQRGEEAAPCATPPHPLTLAAASAPALSIRPAVGLDRAGPVRSLRAEEAAEAAGAEARARESKRDRRRRGAVVLLAAAGAGALGTAAFLLGRNAPHGPRPLERVLALEGWVAGGVLAGVGGWLLLSDPPARPAAGAGE